VTRILINVTSILMVGWIIAFWFALYLKQSNEEVWRLIAVYGLTWSSFFIVAVVARVLNLVFAGRIK
jgi:hypothetical protein